MVKIYLDTNIICDLALDRGNTSPAIAAAFNKAVEADFITPVLSFAHMMDFPEFTQDENLLGELINYYEFLNQHSKWVTSKEDIMRYAIASIFSKWAGVIYEAPPILFDRPNTLFQNVSGIQLDDRASGFFQAFADTVLSDTTLREQFKKIGEQTALAVKATRSGRSTNVIQTNGAKHEHIFRRLRDLLIYVAPHIPPIPENLNSDDIFQFVVNFDLRSCVETAILTEFDRIYDQPGFQRTKESDWKDQMHVPGLLVADVFATRDKDFLKIIKQMDIPPLFRTAKIAYGLEEALLLAA